MAKTKSGRKIIVQKRNEKGMYNVYVQGIGFIGICGKNQLERMVKMLQDDEYGKYVYQKLCKYA